MSRGARLVAAALAVSASAVACGGGDDPTVPADTTATTAATDSTGTTAGGGAATSAAPTTTTTSAIRTIEVKLEKGNVVGGARRETVAVGEKVRIVATADAAEELHVHTYELKIDLKPGEPEEIVFDAAIPGRHEVEFEKAHKLALTLEVK